MATALWLLIRLNTRATLRRLLRGTKSVKGIIFMILGLLVVAGLIFSTMVAPGMTKAPRPDPQHIRIVAPFAILAFALTNLFASASDKAVSFSLAEVDFLFPGPFTRRSLLLYKIFKAALGTLMSGVIFGILLSKYGGSRIACIVGAWLTIQFMQLFAMAITQIGQTVGERAFTRGRRVGLFVVLGTVAAMAIPLRHLVARNGAVFVMSAIEANTVGKIVLAPLTVFAKTLALTHLFPDLFLWGGAALLVNLVMLVIVLSLDANYLETAAAVSLKRHDMIQRARRSGIAGMTNKTTSGVRVRLLPRWGGAGPIAWRQIVSAVRGSRGLLVVLLISTAALSPILFGTGGSSMSQLAGPGMAVWLNLFLVGSLKFDFRDEIDRMDVLRALPIRPIAVAAGEMLTPVIMLMFVQCLLLVITGIRMPHSRGTLASVAAFLPPFDLLLVGVENALFLVYPVRVVGLIAGDMQLFGRQMLILMLRMTLLLVAGGISALIGLLGILIWGKTTPGYVAAYSTGWLVLLIFSLCTVPVCARLYSRFDPSVDTPA